jgi:hypothetical protein
MPRLQVGYTAAATTMLLLVASCSEPTSTPEVEESIAADITPACLPGCTDVDPDPEAPGIYLSNFVYPTNCFSVGTDTDQDGLSDRCENDIALAFAPRMRYHQGDDVGRESYWAAKREGGMIRVIYLLGYYFDLGLINSNDYIACKLSSVGGILASCDGHHGDSEHIVLTLSYNSTTRHWLLDRAALSHHDGYIQTTKPKGALYPSMQWGNKIGGAPLIWVAQGKHANYPTQAACDAGNGGGFLIDLVFSYDTCSGNNSFYTPNSGGQRNIGSQLQQLKGCVPSENPFYQVPRREECFWSASRFYGWQIDRTTSSTGYRAHLIRWGFAS